LGPAWAPDRRRSRRRRSRRRRGRRQQVHERGALPWREMRVAFRGLDRRVPEERLHHAKRGASRSEDRCEGVSELVPLRGAILVPASVGAGLQGRGGTDSNRRPDSLGRRDSPCPCAPDFNRLPKVPGSEISRATQGHMTIRSKVESAAFPAELNVRTSTCESLVKPTMAYPICVSVPLS